MQGRSNLARNASFHARLSLALPNLGLAWRSARTSLAPPSGALAATWFARQRLTPKIYAQASRPPLQTARATAKVRPCEPVVVLSAMPSCMSIVWVAGSRCAHALFRGTRDLSSPALAHLHIAKADKVGWGQASSSCAETFLACIPQGGTAQSWPHARLRPSSGNTGRSPQEWGSCAGRFAFLPSSPHMHLAPSPYPTSQASFISPV
ncbi:hypothetical protein L1887_59822 [Cichorium endivia]|nr:hypothetical protein L1887_59822 [Cichorium endivia]